ncbi:hypothetical protein BC827DRAFT_1229571 [Russula dissimulans]|nr:hypothetical protein BC827DRAFT_1229571 [Russula dissimulans]
MYHSASALSSYRHLGYRGWFSSWVFSSLLFLVSPTVAFESDSASQKWLVWRHIPVFGHLSDDSFADMGQN